MYWRGAVIQVAWNKFSQETLTLSNLKSAEALGG
jgi:hypothetical protein